MTFECDWLVVSNDKQSTIVQTGVPKGTSIEEGERILQLLEDIIRVKGVQE